MATSAKQLSSGAPSRPSTISIAHAKANFSSLVDGVQKKRLPVTILRRGIPVAQLVPLQADAKPKLRDSMAGTARELGDIVSPLGIEGTIQDEDGLFVE